MSQPPQEDLPPPSRAGTSTLARTAAKGMAWSVATGLGSRVFSLVSTLLVTRFVDPKSYGEVSVAYVVTQLASIGTSLGVGQYISTKPHATRRELFHASVLFHGAGLLGLLLVLLFRTPLGPLFGAADIEPYIVGYVVATLFERIALIPESILIRDMRFRTTGLIGTASELTYSVLVLVLAARGMGGMSIVVAGIVRTALRATLGLWVTDRREWLTPHKLDRSIARGVLSYGMPINAARLSSIIARRGDNLAFSRLFGPSRMGAYNLAYNLADTPATAVGERIGDVLVPSFAKLAPAQRPAALQRSIGFVGFVVFPLAAGLSAVSRPLTLFLNDTWQALDVRWMLVVLSVISIARPVEWTVRVYLQVASKTRTIMYIEWAKVVGIMAAIYAFGRLGPVGGCVGVGVTFLVSALVYLAAVARTARVSFVSMLVPLGRPLFCAGAMWSSLFFLDRYALVWITSVTPANTGIHFLDRYVLMHWGAAAGITLGIVAGILIYVAVAYVVARDQVKEIVSRFRSSRKKSPAAEPDKPDTA